MNALDRIRAIDALTFLTPQTLDERVALAMGTARQRLYSHHLANAWLDWIGAHSQEIGKHDMELLAREALRLSPLHERADDLYRAVMRPNDMLPEGQVVFMVTSCVKYFANARRVQQALEARGAIACITIGNTDRRVATWDGEVCTLPVADNYEGLPLKVAAGINAIVARFGAVSVVKIDDDCELTSGFSVARFAELARQHEYVGKPHRDPNHCRYWHFAKTQQSQGPYTRRFHGAWAGGACYLLGPRAAALVAREYALYPAEIGDEYYEDKAIGDFMRRQGVALHTIRHADWGITFDATERFVAPPATVSAAPAGRTVSAIPKTIHIVWLGDDAHRPDNLIATWVAHHPGWNIRVWGNEDLATGHWQCVEQLVALGERNVQALAALMQWEILLKEGGVAVAADSLCLRELDAGLLQHERFTCWVSETAEPGVLCSSYFGCRPGDALVARVLADIRADTALTTSSVSDAVGCSRLTRNQGDMQDASLVVLPSHSFLPRHPAAAAHAGREGVYACELWSTTLGLNETLASFTIEALHRALDEVAVPAQAAMPLGASVNMILMTIRSGARARSVIEACVAACRATPGLRLTVANGGDDEAHAAWIDRFAQAGDIDLVHLRERSIMERMQRALDPGSPWTLFLADDDHFTINYFSSYLLKAAEVDAAVSVIAPSIYLGLGAEQPLVNQVRPMGGDAAPDRLAQLYARPGLNGILWYALLRTSSVLAWLDYMKGRPYFPSYADQLLTTTALIDGQLAVVDDASVLVRDETNWITADNANASDARFYPDPGMVLFHELFWIADLARMLRGRPDYLALLPVLRRRMVSLMAVLVDSSANRMRKFGPGACEDSAGLTRACAKVLDWLRRTDDAQALATGMADVVRLAEAAEEAFGVNPAPAASRAGELQAA